MSKMYMLTVRYHPNNIDYFEDFISFFLTYILRWNKVVSSIEEDGTPDRHLHCIFEDNTSRDREKIVRYLSKDFKPFMVKLKNTETQIDTKFKFKAFQLTNKFKDEELYWRMGYPLKSSPVRVYTRGYEDLDIQEFKNTYIRHKQLENKEVSNVFGITQLTIKNCMAKIQDYYIKNKDKLIFTKDGSNLKYEMIKDRFSLIEINDRTFKKIFQHIRIWNEIGHYGEIEQELFAYDEFANDKLEEQSKYELIERIKYLEHINKELKIENNKLNLELSQK